MTIYKKHLRALTIAGSDSGGGAGIQADLKTFSALGCYGMSVITAITAQNTLEVRGILPLQSPFVKLQLEAVLDDIGVDAVKIGMVHSPEIIKTIADILKQYQISNIVLDPVMVAKSGDKLLMSEAIESMKEHLFPIVKIVTPNLPEVDELLGLQISNKAQMEQAGLEFIQKGCKAVVIKGGHLECIINSPDCLIENLNGKIATHWLDGTRIATRNTHGTGCTFSSSIASFLAHGKGIFESVNLAKEYITQAIKSGSNKSLGKGHGPLDHFYKYY